MGYYLFALYSDQFLVELGGVPVILLSSILITDCIRSAAIFSFYHLDNLSSGNFLHEHHLGSGMFVNVELSFYLD